MYLLASLSYLEKSHNWTEYADHVDEDDIVEIADDLVECDRDASPVMKIYLSCYPDFYHIYSNNFRMKILAPFLECLCSS